MKTWIYKGSLKADTYLYVERENDFSRVPKIVLDLLGSLELVMDIDLAKREKLARAEITEVIHKLMEQGFFLQLPPGDMQSDLPC